MRATLPATTAATAAVHQGRRRRAAAIGDELIIKHGADSPSLGMGAMTMAYKAPKGGVPKDVKAGANVRFEFVVTPQGDMQLTSIALAAEAALSDRRAHSLVRREPLSRAARVGVRRRGGRVGGADARRSTRFPICPTRR